MFHVGDGKEKVAGTPPDRRRAGESRRMPGAADSSDVDSDVTAYFL